MYIHVCAYSYIFVYDNIYNCKYIINIYIYIYIHIYTNIYIYNTHTHVRYDVAKIIGINADSNPELLEQILKGVPCDRAWDLDQPIEAGYAAAGLVRYEVTDFVRMGSKRCEEANIEKKTQIVVVVVILIILYILLIIILAIILIIINNNANSNHNFININNAKQIILALIIFVLYC
jgi:hypothetical protein